MSERDERAEGHEHEVAWESGTQPTRSGSITITEHCTCGAVIVTYHDSIL